MKGLVNWKTLIGILALAGALAVGCEKRAERMSQGSAQVAGQTITQKFCPVTGDPIRKNVYVDYKGRRIYFCDPACVGMFKQDPEKYLKILDEQEAKAQETSSSQHVHEDHGHEE